MWKASTCTCSYILCRCLAISFFQYVMWWWIVFRERGKKNCNGHYISTYSILNLVQGTCTVGAKKKFKYSTEPLLNSNITSKYHTIRTYLIASTVYRTTLTVPWQYQIVHYCLNFLLAPTGHGRCALVWVCLYLSM